MQPTIKDVIGAEKEKEFMESLETMGEPMHRAHSLCGGPWFATDAVQDRGLPSSPPMSCWQAGGCTSHSQSPPIRSALPHCSRVRV